MSGGKSPTKPRTSSSSRRRRPLVLVVDDKVDNREMYLEYLRFVGFEAIGAVDGESAIAAARDRHPAVILMDLSLPGTDGWEATRILKADPATRDVRIVAVTGHAESTCRDEALRAGCDLFIAKPCLPREIAEHVARLIDSPRAPST